MDEIKMPILLQIFLAMYSSTITKYEGNKNQMLVQPGTENGRDSNLNQPPKHMPAEQPLIWRNIIVIVVLHIVAIYLFATRYREAKFWTWMWCTYLLNQLIFHHNFIYMYIYMSHIHISFRYYFVEYCIEYIGINEKSLM